MKARVKATGEILEVILYEKSENAVVVEPRYPTENRMYMVKEVELILDDFEAGKTQINWDEKLIELSGKAMQGIISSKRYYTVDTKYCISTYTYMEKSRVASLSVGIAKELIKQLKEEIK